MSNTKCQLSLSICYLFPTTWEVLGLALVLELGLIQLFIFTWGKEFGGHFMTLIVCIL